MAVKYLSGNRIWGTNAERLAMTITSNEDTHGNLATLGSNGATIVSSPTPPSNLGSNCINFDGANDYLDGYGLMRVMDTKGSISFWFNQDAETDSVLMGMAQSDENTKIEIKTKTTRKLGINVKLDGDTEWEVETSGTYDAFGSWNHVVITHDGIAVKIYLNGSLESLTWANEDTKSVWWTALRTAKVNNFTIGCMPMLNDSSRGDEFDGQMTNIAFWNEEIDSDDVTALYNSGDGALANTITTDQTAYYNCQALEDGTYILENYGTTWSTSSSYYAPTCSADNNYNGVVLNTNSCIKGRVLKKITAYLAKVGSPNTSGTIKLGVWDNTNSGSTITPVATSLVEIQDDIGSLNTLGSTAVGVPITVTLPSTRTLEEYDTIGLELTGGNYDLSNNVAWQYTAGTDVFDGGTTTDTKFTTRNRYTGSAWSGPTMTSDMHCTITTDSDSILNSVITYTYPNLENGTIFITSDTNVHYMWNGPDTWNEVA